MGGFNITELCRDGVGRMKLTLTRHYYGSDATIGILYIDGERFCDTLEDKVRNLEEEAKVAGQTAIPAGMYKVIFNYSAKFKRNLPRLMDVPHFDGILIHRGNTASDTAGCILVGDRRGNDRVVNSTQYEVKLCEKISKAIERGENVTITIE